MTGNTDGGKLNSNPRPKAQNRTLPQSFIALPPRTRLYFSLAVCAIGISGILISDKLEEKFPAPSTSKQQ